MMAVRSGRYIAFAAIFAIVGCSDPDAIRTQDEPSQPKPSVAPIPANQKQFRTLVAMVPVDGAEGGSTWWFFKLSGPIAIVNKYESDFDKLFGTLSSTTDEKNPITWELPNGWTEEGKQASSTSRYATLKSPGGDAEITVTKFGGSVLANVQRWWGDLWGNDKAHDFTTAMLSGYVRQENVKGRLVLRVDLSGPNEPPKRGMMMNPHGGQ